MKIVEKDQDIERLAAKIYKTEARPPGPPEPPYSFVPEWVKKTYRRKARECLSPQLNLIRK